MKLILMSYKPYYFYHIFIAQDKKIEARKKMLPFPHINICYCTRDMKSFNRIQFSNDSERSYMLSLLGKVGGHFYCDAIDTYSYGDMSYPIPRFEGDQSICNCGNGYYVTIVQLEKTCLSYSEFENYGNCKTLYGLHIKTPILCDKPKDLSFLKINRAPQSFCYLKDI